MTFLQVDNKIIKEFLIAYLKICYNANILISFNIYNIYGLIAPNISHSFNSMIIKFNKIILIIYICAIHLK
jgi:hypothetical protein